MLAAAVLLLLIRKQDEPTKLGLQLMGLYWKVDPAAQFPANWLRASRAACGFYEEDAPTKETVFGLMAYPPKVLVMVLTTVVNVGEGRAE